MGGGNVFVSAGNVFAAKYNMFTIVDKLMLPVTFSEFKLPQRPCSVDIGGSALYAVIALPVLAGELNAAPIEAGGFGNKPAPAVIITEDNAPTIIRPH